MQLKVEECHGRLEEGKWRALDEREAFLQAKLDAMMSLSEDDRKQVSVCVFVVVYVHDM